MPKINDEDPYIHFQINDDDIISTGVINKLVTKKLDDTFKSNKIVHYCQECYLRNDNNIGNLLISTMFQRHNIYELSIEIFDQFSISWKQ